ncbi:MAG: choice-of-anchor J domain-containing protein, partial [Marinicellaceae bacterium]
MNTIKIITILVIYLVLTSTNTRATCLLNEDLNSYSGVNGMIEAEDNGWTHYTDFGMDSWRVLPAAGVSFSNAFSVAEETQASLLGITDSFLVTPELILSGQYYLIFSHKYDFEADSSYYDGGQLQITTNGGNTWTDLNQFITLGGYNETISDSFASPIRGQLAWAGEEENFTTVEVDLTSFANQTIQIRWRFVSGIDSIAQLGWRIDDIKVTDSLAATEIIFNNSFEI